MAPEHPNVVVDGVARVDCRTLSGTKIIVRRNELINMNARNSKIH